MLIRILAVYLAALKVDSVRRKMSKASLSSLCDMSEGTSRWHRETGELAAISSIWHLQQAALHAARLHLNGISKDHFSRQRDSIPSIFHLPPERTFHFQIINLRNNVDPRPSKQCPLPDGRTAAHARAGQLFLSPQKCRVFSRANG